jgi:hypothetical protein
LKELAFSCLRPNRRAEEHAMQATDFSGLVPLRMCRRQLAAAGSEGSAGSDGSQTQGSAQAR